MKNSLFMLVLPYVGVFGGALVMALMLTPLFRELNRRIGMVDLPDPRRINKVPIPRGGGIAVVIATFLAYWGFILATHTPASHAFGNSESMLPKLTLLASALTGVGLVDDRYALKPRIKLLCQLVIAAGTWFWADIGFSAICPSLPWWVDLPLTIFWITGAINAFNLIDGLDGLASGLAFIATMGMAGSLLMIGASNSTFLYFSLAGALLGFLRYNYHPASVFLGDSGSMFLGYMISVLPLASAIPNSFFVSIGVPMLAMGVPVFDTSLAILRRSIRHLILKRGGSAGNDQVMTADTDHLHHRILRAVGMNQRRAAWLLYTLALVVVAFGLAGAALKSKGAVLWLVALGVISVVIGRCLARIELYDAGRYLNSLARDVSVSHRRRFSRLSTPVYLVADIFAVIMVHILLGWFNLGPQGPVRSFAIAIMLRGTALFISLMFFRTYRTVWARAQLSNFLRLALACFFGALIGGVAMYFVPGVRSHGIRLFTLVYALGTFMALVSVRVLRQVIRDVFYALDCSRLKSRKDVSRVLVYGAGLRYRTFRRELVRTTSANDRIIVGLLDDDLTLKGHYIGGIKIYGTLQDAPEVINLVNADTVVLCCEVSEEWMKVVLRFLRPTGVKIRHFTFAEEDL